MTMLADQVDLAIGVDTHKHTNTAAVVRAATGGVLEDITASTVPDGLAATFAMALPRMASGHGRSRAPTAMGLGSLGSFESAVSG